MRWSFAWFAAVTTACGGSPEAGFGGSTGDVGQIEASPECGALAQACIGQGLNAPLAAGTALDLIVEYKVPGSSGPPITLASADERVIATPSATRLQAIAPGLSAILFGGPQGAVLDIIHVFVQAPQELRVLRFDASGDLIGQVQPSSQLLVGDEILIGVEPFANGQPLLGTFPLTFESTDPARVRVVPDPVFGSYRVVARAPGSARVSFSALGLDASWQIEVLP